MMEGGGNARFATGVAGNPASTYYIKTLCKLNGKWGPLSINNRLSTGFLTKDQLRKLLQTKSSNLEDFEIADDLFKSKIDQVNSILHKGGINKRNRASVLSCLLLALAQDTGIIVQVEPAVLVNDLNTRAEAMLNRYGKGEFFREIKIELPFDDGQKVLDALRECLLLLKGINIASAIDSGRDVLGECYEQFLKYANDAKEIGIVLTPRHITNFAVNVLQISSRDICFDPACGTGGFLVSALDRVRRLSDSVNQFKKGNLHGIENDPLVAALSIVNMIFRGDGSSNITSANCFDVKADSVKKADKILMNPPFALPNADEFEWRFVERGIGQATKGALLFAVLPTTVMGSANDKRHEQTFRKRLLESNRLLAVVKLPMNLFNPVASKGTHAVVLKIGEQHCFERHKVFWAILDDGFTKSKIRKDYEGNIDEIELKLSEFIHQGIEPSYKQSEIDCSLISESDMDLAPEGHIGKNEIPVSSRFYVSDVKHSLNEGLSYIDKHDHHLSLDVGMLSRFRLVSLFQSYEKGKSGRNIELQAGSLPLISTSQTSNGISEFVDRSEVQEIYPARRITISSNGGCCWAAFHI